MAIDNCTNYIKHNTDYVHAVNTMTSKPITALAYNN